ncbi:MAG: hypothetical protein ACI4ME_00860 [Aristaeellaceae bacterium]
MKKVLALIMAVLMMTSAGIALAEELPEIRFRGMAFGATVAEARKTEELSLSKGNDCIYHDFEHLLSGETWTREQQDDNSEVYLDADLDYVDVAGYPCYFGFAMFYRPVIDGRLCEDDEQAILYGAFYDLYPNSSDMESSADDLKNKLTTLYGKPETQNNLTTWHGANQVDVIMYVAKNSNHIRLSYLWWGAQEGIDEAFAHVEDDKVDNSQNYNGL